MSYRFYAISAIIVIGLTLVISRVRQTRSGKEIFMIFFVVVVALACIIGALAGLSWLLVKLGIAEYGFILQQEI